MMTDGVPADHAAWLEKLPMCGDDASLCPACKGKSRVIKTGSLRSGLLVRYRRCMACGNNYKTVELYSFGNRISLRNKGGEIE